MSQNTYNSIILQSANVYPNLKHQWHHGTLLLFLPLAPWVTGCKVINLFFFSCSTHLRRKFVLILILWKCNSTCFLAQRAKLENYHTDTCWHFRHTCCIWNTSEYPQVSLPYAMKFSHTDSVLAEDTFKCFCFTVKFLY